MEFKYKGKLEFYFETGEICFPMLQDIRGIDEKGFYSWDWAYVFGKQSKVKELIIKDKNKVLYQGPWTFSRENTGKNNYFCSPKEIDPMLWRKYCLQSLDAEIVCEDKVDGEKQRVFLTSSKDYEISIKTKRGYSKILKGTCIEVKEGDHLSFRTKDKVGFKQHFFGIVESVVIKRESGVDRVYVTTIKDNKKQDYLIQEGL